MSRTGRRAGTGQRRAFSRQEGPARGSGLRQGLCFPRELTLLSDTTFYLLIYFYSLKIYFY